MSKNDVGVLLVRANVNAHKEELPLDEPSLEEHPEADASDREFYHRFRNAGIDLSDGSRLTVNGCWTQIMRIADNPQMNADREKDQRQSAFICVPVPIVQSPITKTLHRIWKETIFRSLVRCALIRSFLHSLESYEDNRPKTLG